MPDAEKKTSAAKPKGAGVAATGEPGTLKQRRALQTRRKLIHAARTIFARDGFEHARLEDIAKAAGKTRGAFYDHFQDKEDVFFAIFEDNINTYRNTIRPLLQQIDTLEGRIDRLTAYLVDKTHDRQKALLALEFKVYAIRHPRRRKRLADLHAAIALSCSLPELEEMLPALGIEDTRISRAESLALSALMDGFALNHLFDPPTLNEEQIRRFLRLSLEDALHVAQASRPAGKVLRARK